MILEMDESLLTSPLRPWLVVLFPPELAEEIPIGPGPLVIGRSAHRSNLVLPDELISRRHCRLYWENGTVHVEDLGSTNGTFIDGIAVTEAAPLSPSAKLQLGQVILKLEMRRGETPPAPDIPIARPPLPSQELRDEASEYLDQCRRREISVAAVAVKLSGEQLNQPDIEEFTMGEVGEILRRELLSDDMLGHLSPRSFLMLTGDISPLQTARFVETLRKWLRNQRFFYEGKPVEISSELSFKHFPTVPPSLDELIDSLQSAF